MVNFLRIDLKEEKKNKKTEGPFEWIHRLATQFPSIQKRTWAEAFDSLLLWDSVRRDSVHLSALAFETDGKQYDDSFPLLLFGPRQGFPLSERASVPLLRRRRHAVVFASLMFGNVAADSHFPRSGAASVLYIFDTQLTTKLLTSIRSQAAKINQRGSRLERS